MRTEQWRLERERLTCLASGHSHADQESIIWLAVIFGEGYWDGLLATEQGQQRQGSSMTHGDTRQTLQFHSNRAYLTPLSHIVMLSSFLQCYVISLLFFLSHPFAPKELFFNWPPIHFIWWAPAKRTLSPLCFSLSLIFLPLFSPSLHSLSHHHPPRLPSFSTPVYFVAQRGWLSLMNSLFSLQPGTDLWLWRGVYMVLWVCVTHTCILPTHIHGHDCDHFISLNKSRPLSRSRLRVALPLSLRRKSPTVSFKIDLPWDVSVVVNTTCCLLQPETWVKSLFCPLPVMSTNAQGHRKTVNDWKVS